MIQTRLNMGIYPTTEIKNKKKNEDGSEEWDEVYNDFSGCIRTRHVKAGPYVEEWTDCFCCSCNHEPFRNDPACRNHGFAAKRPCEVHNMPGQPWEYDKSGKIPESVQETIRKYQAQDAEYFKNESIKRSEFY
jgi:hypothetical protein